MLRLLRFGVSISLDDDGSTMTGSDVILPLMLATISVSLVVHAVVIGLVVDVLNGFTPSTSFFNRSRLLDRRSAAVVNFFVFAAAAIDLT